MTLENQVTSLGLSKRLKELGVEQYKALYSWGYTDDGEAIYPMETQWGEGVGKIADAFTVAELGELLPKGYHTLLSKEDGWVCFPKSFRPYEPRGALVQSQWSDTEANARAKMLIYLIENKLI